MTDTLKSATSDGVVLAAAGGQPAGVRRARLDLVRIDPWSVMKLSFVLSLAAAIIIVVAVALLWLTLDGAGVIPAVDRTITDFTGDTTSFDFSELLSFPRVMGFALLVAVIHVVLLTALATLGAFLYNLAVGMVGGLDITLAEG